MGRMDARRERPLPSTPAKRGLSAPEHTPSSSRPMPCFYRQATSEPRAERATATGQVSQVAARGLSHHFSHLQQIS